MQDDTHMNGFVVGNSTEIDPIYAQGHSHAQLEALKRKLRGISLAFPSNVKTAMSPEEDLLALYKKYRYWGSRVRDAQAAPPVMAGYLGLEPPQQEDPTENLRLALKAIAHGPTLAPVLDTPVKTSMDLASSTQLVNSFITPQDDGVLGFMAPPVNTGGTMGGLHRLLMAVSAAGSPGNYKHADHPQDRLEQRTSLPANYTHRLRKVLAKSTLPKGDAYARMPDNSFAVFKDAGGKKRLASFLSKHMTPRGKDITTPVREGLKTASEQSLEHLRGLLAKFKKDADKAGYNYFVIAHGDDPTVGAETSRVQGQPDSVIREHKKLHSDFSKSIGTEHVNWGSKTAEAGSKSKPRPMSDKALAKALGLKVEELPKNLHTAVAEGNSQEGTSDLLKALRKMSKTAGFANEPLAQKAHQAVVDEYGLTEADGSKYWKLKTHIYKKMGGTFTGRRDPPKN